ncbi:MAG: DNA polymerase I, partial [Bacteroidia bacterium]
MKLNDLILKLKDGFCFDTETCGSNSGDAVTIHSLELVGIAFAIAPGEAFYLPIPTQYDKAVALISVLKEVFEDPLVCKTGHNLKFDINVLRRYGIRVQGPLFDTMIAHYLCNPQAKHGLKAISLALLGYKQIEISELIGFGKDQQSMRNIPVREVADYACEDADQTLQLRQVLEPMLKKRKLEVLFHTIECPLIYVLADMEYEGICVNPELLNSISEQAYRELALEKQKLDTLSGIHNFNPNSTVQLRELLFEKLGLDSIT